MDLSGIIAISGMSGLYKVIAQTKSGLIVESLSDKKRIPTYAHHKVSALEDISMYSTGEDVPLREVFQLIYEKEKGGAALDPKSSDTEIRAYFGQAFKEYDQERVYTSDIRKALTWYNQLHKADMLKIEKKAKDTKSKEEAATADGTEKKAKATPAKKTPAKTVKAKETAKPVKATAPKVKTTATRKTGGA